MKQHRNWFVVTGAPSTGKTSVINMLANRGYPTVPEAARMLIDRAKLQGVSTHELRKDCSSESAFRDAVLIQKLTMHIMAAQIDTQGPVFFDRGLPDDLAFQECLDIEPLSKIGRSAVQSVGYGGAFILEALPVFEQDYARTEPQEFERVFTPSVHRAYRSVGVPTIPVQVMSVSDRVDFILSKIPAHLTAI